MIDFFKLPKDIRMIIGMYIYSIRKQKILKELDKNTDLDTIDYLDDEFIINDKMEGYTYWCYLEIRFKKVFPKIIYPGNCKRVTDNIYFSNNKQDKLTWRYCNNNKLIKP